MALAPALSPHGVLSLKPSDDTPTPDSRAYARIEHAFARGAGHGLLHLGAEAVGIGLPPVLSYWREFGARYVTALCSLPGIAEGRHKPAVPAPGDADLSGVAAAVPPMLGAEYLTPVVLGDLWRGIDAAFDPELEECGLAIQAFLKSRHAAWNLVGRVHFNLAENRKDEET